jgi:hypothetical protein
MLSINLPLFVSHSFVAHAYCAAGLLGMLLAYRFPECTVHCVDLERRESFDAFMAAFELKGQPADGSADGSVAGSVAGGVAGGAAGSAAGACVGAGDSNAGAGGDEVAAVAAAAGTVGGVNACCPDAEVGEKGRAPLARVLPNLRFIECDVAELELEPSGTVLVFRQSSLHSTVYWDAQ